MRAFATQNGIVITTRDKDFADLDALLGAPPKVIWIHRENAPTAEYERLLRTLHEQIEAFGVEHLDDCARLFMRFPVRVVQRGPVDAHVLYGRLEHPRIAGVGVHMTLYGFECQPG